MQKWEGGVKGTREVVGSGGVRGLGAQGFRAV